MSLKIKTIVSSLRGKVLLAVALVIAVLALWWGVRASTHLETSVSEFSTTASRIEAIKQIGEWEFLAISDEEIVDTTGVVKRIWPLPDGKKYLARIYKGTLRLGFDLQSDAPENWITVSGDSVSAVLPGIRLLDERFIDETATKPLMEDGDWTSADRQRLYVKAARQMKARCLTESNCERARGIAIEQVTELLKSLGFRQVSVK